MDDQFVLREEPVQLSRIECGLLKPSDANEGRDRFSGIADFRVIQSAEAKKSALTHDHANQKRAGGTRKLRKLCDEPQFLRGQQIPISRLERRQDRFEVLEVVERIREDSAAPCIRG